MGNRLVKTLIFTGGIFLLAYVALYSTWEVSKLLAWSRSGMTDNDIEVSGDSTWVASRIDSSEFLGPFIPAVGDTLVAVNDSLRTFAEMGQPINLGRKPGTQFKLTFLHNGREREVILVSRKVEAADAIPFILLLILRLLIILSFIEVGLWAFQKRSDSAGVRALTLFSFAIAAFMLTTVRIFDSRFASFAIPYQGTVERSLRVFWIFTGGFWLNLQLLFPHVSERFRRLKGWGYLLVYLPQVVILALLFTHGTRVSPFTGRVITLGTTAQLILGFFLLVRHYQNAISMLERRQTRLVMYGSAVGLVALLLLLGVGTFFGTWFQALGTKVQLAVVNSAFLALLLTPLSLAYALGKYRLLEVEGKLKRGTRHLLLTIALLAVFFLAVYLIGELLVRELGITSQTPTILIAMLLALGITPVQRRLQGVLERKFFSARFQLKVMIDDFIQRMGSFPDRETLYRQLSIRLHEAAGVENIVAVLKQSNGAFRTETDAYAPFRGDSDFILHLERTGRPVPLDEAMASLRIPFTDRQVMWFRHHNVHLILPMFARMRLIGFLGLGGTTQGADYTPEMVDILSGLVNQVALASENLRLLEDNLEKKRLEEELRMARNIQEGFLPRQIPETPGLEVAARSKFSLEVAGDYYDVIALKDGKSVIAVGDVSGKGAGAALIMANLQASLRTAVKVGVDLKEVVGEINDLIWQNTPEDQYVTFFVGVYDPSSQMLTYVNAGHNPPLLFRNGSVQEELSIGGLVLGVFPGELYEAGILHLEKGDRLLLYTDGISEAMNARGEEFGLNRMLVHLQNHTAHTSYDLLEKLEHEVIRFHGTSMLDDDSTLLLATVDALSEETA